METEAQRDWGLIVVIQHIQDKAPVDHNVLGHPKIPLSLDQRTDPRKKPIKKKKYWFPVHQRSIFIQAF